MWWAGRCRTSPQDAVQEFQVATNRFSAELGRSAGSVINVVTRSGGDTPQGSAALFLRDQRWQALPATARSRRRRRSAVRPPAGCLHVRRSAAAASASSASGRWRSATRTAACWSAFATPRRGRSDAPTPRRRSTICSARFALDWRASAADDVMIRYSGSAKTTSAASTRGAGDRHARRSGSSRATACTRVLGTWTRVLSPRAVNSLSVSYSDFDNAIAPVEPGVQLTFPSLQAGSSFRVPQGTIAEALAVRRRVLARARHASVEVWRAAAARGRPVRPRRVPRRPHRAGRGLPGLRSQRRRARRRRRPAVCGHVAERQARSGSGDSRRRQRASRRLRPGRLARPSAALTEPRPPLRNRHRREQHQPGRRTESDRRAVRRRLPRQRDTNNWAPRVGFNWSTADARHERPRRLRHLLRPRHAADPIARARPRRAGAADRSARRQRVLHGSGDRPRAAVRANALEPVHRVHPARRRRLRASTSSIRDLQNPKVQQMSLGIERQLGRGRCCASTSSTTTARDFIIGRTVGTVFNPVVGGPDRVVNLESSAETDYDALLVEFERRFSGRFGFRAAYTLSAGVQLRQRRSDSVRQRPDRSRTTSRASTGRRRTTSATGWRCRVSSISAPGSSSPGSWTLASGVPMDILMPSGADRASRPFSGTPAVAVFTSAGELNSVHPATERQRRASTASCCRSSRTARASTTRSIHSTSACSRDVSRRPVPHRGAGRGVQPLQRDQHPRHVTP